MNYKIKIEGQEIEMPEEIAGDDASLKSALSPYFPGAANAKFMRSEEKDGVITVTVVKQAGTKGAKVLQSEDKDGLTSVKLVELARTKGSGDGEERNLIAITKGEHRRLTLGHPDYEATHSKLVASLPVGLEDQVLRKLIEAPEDFNPLIVLDQKLSSLPAMNQCPFETMLKRDEEIGKALTVGEAEASNMEKTFRSLVETKPQPAPMLTAGF